jgi:phosphoserine aminotransferase
MSTPLKRAHNFSPGPGMLSTRVVERAQAEFADFQGSGMAVFEITNLDKDGMSHPGIPRHSLQTMMMDAERKLRDLMEIPAGYRVLFMHGGAVAQFSAVPLNLMSKTNAKADFVNAGFWSQRAMTEAKKYVDVHVCAEFDDRVKAVSEWDVRQDADYVHICLNETVKGLEVLEDPDWPADYPPLIADATSTILSRPIDITKYGAIYASGGKNVPANMCIVIIKESLLRTREAHPFCPQTMDYRLNGGGLATSSVFQSNPNTPPTWAVYLLDLVLDDVIATHGSIKAVAAYAQKRIAAVYNVADSSGGFYRNTVFAAHRSRMNAVFKLPSREMDRKFVDEAEAAGLLFLFGHPVEGGIRVTSYIGLADEALVAVAKFMQEFADANKAK